jgi:acylphosphatase
VSVVARRLAIRGRVQGVGFRYAMVEAAEAAGIVGWVRNRRDGSVEAVVQGDGAAVLAIVAWCERGPAGAKVTDVEVVDLEPDSTLTGFAQRATA